MARRTRGELGDARSSSSRAVAAAAWRRAASSEASSRLLGLVDETRRRAWSMPPRRSGRRAEMQHRRLGEAAGVLVRARDDEVGARRQRVLGQARR